MEHDKEEHKVEVLTIKTPAGEIPTAKALKKLAEYWNSIITEMNESREQLNRELREINESTDKIGRLVKTHGQKIKLLIENVRDVKVKMNTLGDVMVEIRENMRKWKRSPREDKKKTIEQTARDILLKNEKEDES